MGNSGRLRRAVIKEELVALTGDFVKAVILQQFIFWSERVDDFDHFILEERQRAKDTGQDVTIDLTRGWIYKKADELSHETMLGLSKSNMMNHIKKLIANGWVEQRRNPKNKMDKTYQYRVNISSIQKTLLSMGYTLEGYRVPLDFIMEFAESRSSETESPSPESKLRNPESIHPSPNSALTSFDSKLRSSESHTRTPDTEQQYQRSQSQTTPQTTNTHNETAHNNANTSTNRTVCEYLTQHLRIPLNQNTLHTWRSYADDETILAVATIVSNDKRIQNPIGYINSVLKNGFTPPTNQSGHQHLDTRYEEFYKLFPNT